MRKAYRYRIYPTHAQETILEQTLAACCELYNAALQERRDAYRICGKSIGYTDQQNQLPEIKQLRLDLKSIHSQVLQDVLRRLDKGFDAFFRRVKAGEKPGFPRFRSRSRYNSFTYPQSGFAIKGGKVRLAKIGGVKIKQHRQIEGQIKTCTIMRTASGKWFASCSVQVEAETLPQSAEAVGVDANLVNFATLSTGEKIENPRFFRQEEQELGKAQRRLAAAEKGSKQRKKRKKIVARIHERIANKRNNFAHQESRKIIHRYGIICIEDLRILNMMRNHCLAKSIADAAWSLFFHCVAYKAGYAGRRFVKVEPRHTSQDCHRCGQRRKDLSLRERIYHCANPECLLIIDRDENAALNVLGLGLQALGLRAIEAASVYGAE